MLRQTINSHAGREHAQTSTLRPSPQNTRSSRLVHRAHKSPERYPQKKTQLDVLICRLWSEKEQQNLWWRFCPPPEASRLNPPPKSGMIGHKKPSFSHCPQRDENRPLAHSQMSSSGSKISPAHHSVRDNNKNEERGARVRANSQAGVRKRKHKVERRGRGQPT